MKNFSLGLALFTILFFAVPTFGQLTASAMTGATFFIADKATAKPAPMLEGRIGYTVNASDVARINMFA